MVAGGRVGRPGIASLPHNAREPMALSDAGHFAGGIRTIEALADRDAGKPRSHRGRRADRLALYWTRQSGRRSADHTERCLFAPVGTAVRRRSVTGWRATIIRGLEG